VLGAGANDIRKKIVTEAGGGCVFGFGSNVHGWRLPVILLMVAYFAADIEVLGLEFRSDVSEPRHMFAAQLNVFHEHLEWAHLQAKSSMLRDNIQRHING